MCGVGLEHLLAQVVVVRRDRGRRLAGSASGLAARARARARGGGGHGGGGHGGAAGAPAKHLLAHGSCSARLGVARRRGGTRAGEARKGNSEAVEIILPPWSRGHSGCRARLHILKFKRRPTMDARVPKRVVGEEGCLASFPFFWLQKKRCYWWVFRRGFAPLSRHPFFSHPHMGPTPIS